MWGTDRVPCKITAGIPPGRTARFMYGPQPWELRKQPRFSGRGTCLAPDPGRGPRLPRRGPGGSPEDSDLSHSPVL
ncbi:hypothetical protein NDU88_002138 [Pleurodeles waltl]|uniref:Uncharacterized protein n=1 Tax=Pleurodeles waltl TaxID=8319 RepID=A0AAV7MNI4_PLEWA|nr:hypothetical protein NDU88_002138 [Pleurodeles waltl]